MLQLVEQIIKLVLAATLSAPIGIEREKSHKPAGLRTHVLVCLGATLSAILGVDYFGNESARVIAAVITGIGFLGAGSIIWSHRSVHGLTTAATIWAVAILGIAVGIGAYWISIVFTIIVLLLLRIKKIERKL